MKELKGFNVLEQFAGPEPDTKEPNVQDDPFVELLDTFGEPEKQPYEMYQADTGFLSDTWRSIKKGSLATVETLGDAMEAMGIPGGQSVSDWAYFKNRDIRPDYSEFTQTDPTVYKWYKEAVGMVPATLGIVGLGIVDPLFAVGAIGSLSAGRGYQATEEYLQKYPEEIEKATEYGLKIGAADAASQAIMTALPFGLGKLARFGGSKATINGLGDMLKTMTPKEIAKIGADAFGVQGGTMALNTYYQVLEANKAGLTDMDPTEAALQTIGPAAFLSLGFSAAGMGLAAKEKAKLKKNLNDLENPFARMDAVDTLYSGLKKKANKETADLWYQSAKEAIKEGLEIPVDASFDNFYTALDEFRKSSPPTMEELKEASVDELKAYIDSELELRTPRENVREVRTPEKPVGYTRSLVKGDVQNALERSLLKPDVLEKPVETTIETPKSTKGKNDLMDLKMMEEQKPSVKKPIEQKDTGVNDSLPLIKRASVIKLLPKDLQKKFAVTEDPRIIDEVYNVMNSKRNLLNKREGTKNIKERANITKQIRQLDESAANLLGKKEPVVKPKEELQVKPKEEPQVKPKEEPQVKPKEEPEIQLDKLEYRPEDTRGFGYDAEGNLVETAASPEDLLIQKELASENKFVAETKDYNELSDVAKAFATLDEKGIKKFLNKQKANLVSDRMQYREKRARELMETEGLPYNEARNKAEREYTQLKYEADRNKLIDTIYGKLDENVRKNVTKGSLIRKANKIAKDKPKAAPHTVVRDALESTANKWISKADIKELIRNSKEQKKSVSRQQAYADLLDSAKKDLEGYSLEQIEVGSDFYNKVLGIEHKSRAGKLTTKSRIEELQELGLSKEDAELASMMEDQIAVLQPEEAEQTRQVYQSFLEEKIGKKAEAAKDGITLGNQEKPRVTPDIAKEPSGKPRVIKIRKNKELTSKEAVDTVKDLTVEDKKVETDDGPNVPWNQAETAEDLLKIISSMDTVGDYYKFIAKYLLESVDKKVLRDVLVRGKSVYEIAERKAAFFDKVYSEIALNYETSARTALHEVVHSITANALHRLPKNHKLHKRLNTVRNHLANELVDKGILIPSDIYIAVEGGKILKNALSRDSQFTLEQKMYLYTLSSNEELLSMSMTIPKIQETLKSIKLDMPKSSKLKTLWDLVVQTIGKVLGVSGDDWTALHEILDITVVLSEKDNSPLVYDFMGMMAQEDYWDIIKKESKLDSDEKYKRYRERLRAIEKEKTTPNRLRETLVKLASTYDKYLEPVDERIRRVSTRLYGLINKMEAKKSIKEKEYAEKMLPFLKKYDAIKDQIDKQELALALFNSHHTKDRERLFKLLDKYGMRKDFDKIQEIMKDIRERMESVGIYLFKTPYDTYYPRRVADTKGLYKFLMGSRNETQTGYFDDILSNKSFTDEQKEQLIAARISSGYHPARALSIPSSAKNRNIPYVTPETLKFYEDPVMALRNTVLETNEAIATRELVGVRERKKLQDEINRLWERYAKSDNKKQKRILERRIQSKLLKIRDIKDVSDESISQFINKNAKNLTDDQVTDLMAALRARLNQRGMSGGLAKVRDVGLISALGSPLNTITQLADIIWSTYKNGPKTTIEALFGKKEITADDFNMDHLMQQFDTEGLQGALDWVLRKTGFKWVDKLGKTTSMQASLLKARKMSKEDFVKQWGPMFSDEVAGKIWEDIKNHKITDKVKYFVFTDVSKFQPISLSQMPEAYLKAGNGRIFYTLKSYNLRQLSVLRREIFEEIRNGDKTKGMRNLAALLTLIVGANATTDELKDFILGRDASLSDRLMDNLLTIAFINRYTLEKGQQKGFLKTFFSDILVTPGFTTLDPFLSDIANLVNKDKEPTYATLKSIPVIGRVAYYRFTPEGKRKTLKRFKKDIYSTYKKKGYRAVLKDIRKYNKEARSIGEKPITSKNLRRLKARLKSKQKKKLNFNYRPYLNVVDAHAHRFGVPIDNARRNMEKFAQFVAEVESDFNPTAKNKHSSASGLFQYVKGSVDPAVNRLKRYVDTDEYDWIAKASDTKDLSQLTPEEQLTLFAADILEKRGSDRYLKKILESGDPKAMLLAYYKLHHTSPDAATKKRALRILRKYV